MNLLKTKIHRKNRLKNKVNITNTALVSLLLTGNITYGSEIINKNVLNLKKGKRSKTKETIGGKRKKKSEADEFFLIPEEIKVLTFFNFDREIDKRHDSDVSANSSNEKPTIPEKPQRPIDNFDPIAPEVNPLRPIDNFDPITPEVDPLRPIDNFDPITPEVDPLRPIDNFDPITPEVNPLRPIDNFDPITPEVDPKEVIIWKNGKDIYGEEYILDEDLQMTGGTHGLSTTGGIIINEAVISSAASTEDYYAMSVSDHTDGREGTGINRGFISGKSKGMIAKNGGEIINNTTGIISLDSDVGGMVSEGAGSSALNIGSILKGGMQAYNFGTIINNGTVDEMSSYSGSSAVNKGEIKAPNSLGSYGMYATDESVITNDGSIVNNSDNGMKAEKSSTAINNKVISNTGQYGMYIEGAGSIGINKGTISNGSDYGLYTRGNGATTTNNGIVSNLGDTGIMAFAYSTAINNGTISNKGNYRMEALSKSTVINNGNLDDGFDNYTVMRGGDQSNLINTGVIDINYDHSTAMKGMAGGTVVNKGTININSNSGRGMYINGGGTATNEGVINLNGRNGTGIYAEGSNTKVVNTGTINLSGSSSDEGETDNKGNRSIFLYDGASLVNSGEFNLDGSINFDSIGDGKFIMSKGGTLKADRVEGDIYVSGALTLGGYSDEYSTYKILETNEFDGTIISDSAMFDTHLTENSSEEGFYDVTLERKDFHDIIVNQELADILEENYSEGGSSLKEDYYDSLKLISTESDLENNVKSSYGIDTYTTFTKQTLDIVNNTKNVISKNILRDPIKLEVGEFRAIGGGGYLEKDNDGYTDVSGYETNIFNVYLGGEKQVNNTTKIGGILTIGSGDTSYDNGADRSDDYFQGTSYLKYEDINNILFTTMIFMGTTKSDIKRPLKFGLIASHMEDKVRSNYLGVANTLSKKFYTSNRNTYIEPKIEYNMTLIKQDDINESGDYGVKIKGEDSFSLEPGIGVTLGHRFDFKDGSKLILEESLAGYLELGNPYKDNQSQLDILSHEKVKVESYENNDYYGKANIDISYITKKELTFRTGITFKLGENQDNIQYEAGMGYRF